MSTHQAIETITELMSQLDVIKCDEPDLGSECWAPTTAEGHEILNALTAAENRDALNHWYARFNGASLNPVAMSVKRAVESRIGEPLA